LIGVNTGQLGIASPAADQLFNPPRELDKEVDELARLAELHRTGALTDTEFAKQKGETDRLI
jgi:hypothetical protein